MLRKLIFIVTSLLVFISSYAQKQKIALHLTKGTTYYQQTAATSSVIQTINGQEVKVDITIGGKMSFKVNDVNNSLYEMEVKYDGLTMGMQMSGNNFEFNSESENPNDVFSQILSTIKEKSFFIKISEKGIIAEIRNADSLFADIFTKFPQLPDAQKEQLSKQLKQSYGEKAIKSSLEMGLAIFPESPVAKGDTWTKNTRLETTMVSNVTTVYQLKEISADAYQIHSEGEMATDDKGDNPPVNGVIMKYNLKGKTVSDIQIDKASGWVIEVKSKQGLKGTVETKSGTEGAENVSSPMEVITETVLKGGSHL